MQFRVETGGLRESAAAIEEALARLERVRVGDDLARLRRGHREVGKLHPKSRRERFQNRIVGDGASANGCVPVALGVLLLQLFE